MFAYTEYPLQTPSHGELFCKAAAKTESTYWIDLAFCSGLGLTQGVQRVECKMALQRKNQIAERLRISPIWIKCHIWVKDEMRPNFAITKEVFIKKTDHFIPIEGELYTAFPIINLEGKAKDKADRSLIMQSYKRFKIADKTSPAPISIRHETSSITIRPWSKDTFLIEEEGIGKGSEKNVKRALKVKALAHNRFKVSYVAEVVPIKVLDLSLATGLNPSYFAVPKPKNIRRFSLSNEPSLQQIWIEKLGIGDLYSNLKHITSEDVFYELCQELLFELFTLHSHNLIHGDLKPANFMLYINEEGKLSVKIADMNTVHVRRENTHLFGIHTDTYLPFNRRILILKAETKFVPIYEIEHSIRSARKKTAISNGFKYTETFKAEGISMGLALAALYIPLTKQIPFSSKNRTFEAILESLIGYPMRDASDCLYPSFSDFINAIDQDLFTKTEEEIEHIIETRLSIEEALEALRTLHKAEIPVLI